MHATRSCTLLCAILACHHWYKEAGKGLIGACTRMRCAVLAAGPRVQSAVERSARTVHASTRGGRLRAGPSFLAKVDLLIGRWPGWEGGTHLCSRCSSSSHHIKPALVMAAHCCLVERWPASGAQLLRSSTTEVSSLSSSGAGVDFAGRALAKVGAGAGGGWTPLEPPNFKGWRGGSSSRRCPASSAPPAPASANLLQKS